MQPSAVDLLSNLDDIREHYQLMFRRGWERLDEAKPGGIHLVPQKAIQKDLEADYEAMAGMMFGEAPEFAWILDELQKIEAQLNA